LIYVVEGSCDAVAAAMHLFDWTELLVDERVIWCVGENPHETLEREIAGRPGSPTPQTVIASPPWQVATAGRVKEVIQRSRARYEREAADARERTEATYRDRGAAFWADRYAAALIGQGPPLRVLGLTSRFTTVLQYSTRDAMAALAELGCETRTLIEPDDHGFISPLTSLREIREFDPDLIFMIDHTRRSQRSLLVESVPVVTWIQDRLRWLFDAETGRSLGPLDFCMGQGRDELVEKHGYPAERFMSCEMATRAKRVLPEHGHLEVPGITCDIAYASNMSDTPAQFHAHVRSDPRNAAALKLIDAVFEELSGRCARDELNGSLYLDRVVDSLAAREQISVRAAERDALIAEFARPVSDRLLRQQTLKWAANWVRESGGRLHLYGRGWERNPQFAEFSRGVLEPGAELNASFSAAKINLHTGCNPGLHQRVFDGLGAGGFFLIRTHGADVSHRVSRAIFDLIRRTNASAPVEISEGDLPEPVRREYAELRRYNGCGPAEPFVATERHFRQYERLFVTRTVQLAGQVWPELDRVVFSTEPEFVERASFFLTNPDARTAIANSMCKAVVARFGYRALMEKLLHWMTDQLLRQSSEFESSGASLSYREAVTRCG
ncbi:MAG TPA: glycosyltransferase, partial [Phycisphaerae bacterium]|nr:glycosyltransferase [Phycisphaerae bacterium]